MNKQTFKFLSNRMIVVYLLVAAFTAMTVDVKGLMFNAKAETLSRLRPKYNQFMDNYHAGTPLDPINLQNAVYYYQQVVKTLPNLPATYGLMAFNQYQLGQVDEAIKSYQIAIDRNPTFFWFYYNLGVIYFNQGEYKKALPLLQRAYNTKDVFLMKFLLVSKLYLPLLLELENRSETLQNNLNLAKSKTLALIMTSELLINYDQTLAQGFGVKPTAPMPSLIYLEVARRFIEDEQYAKSQYLLEQSVRFDPQNVQALELISKTFEKTDQKQAAETFQETSQNVRKSLSYKDLTKYQLIPQLF